MNRKLLFVVLLLLLTSLTLAACGGDDASTDDTPADGAASEGGDAVAGETLFQQSCSACHGVDGKGMPNLGKDLTTSDFVNEMGDAELVTFVKQGRSVSDPDNTTGVDMPPKGGNPALSDGDLNDIVAYIRTLSE